MYRVDEWFLLIFTAKCGYSVVWVVVEWASTIVMDGTDEREGCIPGNVR